MPEVGTLEHKSLLMGMLISYYIFLRNYPVITKRSREANDMYTDEPPLETAVHEKNAERHCMKKKSAECVGRPDYANCMAERSVECKIAGHGYYKHAQHRTGQWRNFHKPQNQYVLGAEQ